MILSLHIPKSGGESFRARLRATFGARLLIDYADWEEWDTPEIAARRAGQIAAARARADELQRDYDVIHGHYKADKYRGIFSDAHFMAFFRDPYQQAVSHYRFFLRHPEIQHPAVQAFHYQKMSLADFAATFPNIQSLYLGTLPVEDLAMVGLMESYEKGIALFEAIFGHKLADAAQENVNPERTGDLYEIDAATRAAVDRHRAGDLDLYHAARARFDRLCARHGI